MIFLSNSFWSLKLLTLSSFKVFDMCLILEKPKEKKASLTCLENIAASKAWCYPIYSCFDNILIAPCYIKNIFNKSCLFILVDKIFDHFKSTYEIYRTYNKEWTKIRIGKPFHLHVSSPLNIVVWKTYTYDIWNSISYFCPYSFFLIVGSW